MLFLRSPIKEICVTANESPIKGISIKGTTEHDVPNLPHHKSKKLCIYIIVLVLVTEIYSLSKNSSISKYIVVLRNKEYPSKELLSVMSHTYQSKKLFSYLPHCKSKKLCVYIIILVLVAEIYSLSKNSCLSKYIVVYPKLSKV